MHCPSGEIVMLSTEELSEAVKSDPLSLIPIERDEIDSVTKMSKPKRKNWMRNHPCPCKSGKKFKRCCWGKISA